MKLYIDTKILIVGISHHHNSQDNSVLILKAIIKT